MRYQSKLLQKERCTECPLFLHRKCMIVWLPQDVVEQLQERKKMYAFKKHSTIFEKNDACIGIYFVRKGKIKIFKIGNSGREQIVRLENEGDVVGYRAFFSDTQIYSASAVTMEDSVVCFLSKEIFYPVVTMKNTFIVNIIKKVTKDLEAAEEQIINLSQEYVIKRIIQAILKLAGTFGYKEDMKTINVRVTKAEIAGLAGTTNETAIRVISQLQKEKLVEVKQKEIKILKHQELMKYARE